MDFERNKQLEKQAKQWLRSLSKPVKLWVLLTVVLGLSAGLLLVAQMYCLSQVVYLAYIKQASSSVINHYFITLFLLILVRAGLLLLKERVSFQTSSLVRCDLRQRLLRHINTIGPIHAGRLPTGQLVSTVLEQVEGLHDFLVYYLPQMSLAVFIPVAILCFVFPINLTSGFILLICAPLIPFFMALVGMGAASLQQKHFQSLARMSTQFLDALQGLATLKLFGVSKRQTQRIFNSSEAYRERIMSVLRVAFLSSAVLEVFSAAAIALLAIYLGMGFINTGTHSQWWSFHHLTLQGALFILLLAPEFFLPLRELGTHYHAKAKAVGAAIEIDKVLSIKPSQHPELCSLGENSEFNDKLKSIQVSFNSVSFCYPGRNQAALDQVNLMVTAGEKVAIVGPSGAGKTSLVNGLLKFITPDSGGLLINGIDLATIPESKWYPYVAWMGQAPTIFQGSVRANLLLANPKASDSLLLEAIQFAQLDGFVKSLPEGLNTLLGEQGMGLSGGQKQRLALARVYLKRAPLLLLDEPTASLDQSNEQAIFSSLETFWQDKTVLLLTHRFSFLERMDRVVVIDEGRCVQQGSVDELLQDQQGLFYQLYQQQESLL